MKLKKLMRYRVTLYNKFMKRLILLDSKLKELKFSLTGRRQAELILSEGERVDGSSLFKGLIDAGLSDLYVVPVYRTAFLNPFDPKSLDFICRFLTPDGNPAGFAPDNILLSAHDFFKKKTGLELHAMGELEFYLIYDQNERSYPNPEQQGYHASAPFVKSGQILDEMAGQMSMMTGQVKYTHSEVGFIQKLESESAEIKDKAAEQLEIEFLPAPVEEAADILVLARWLIRNVAFRHGCLATFTPKLEEKAAGTGLHIHAELKQKGKNLMADIGGKLSAQARMLIGGLCHYADTLTAFGNTQASSYLRLTPNQEAPTRICWSDSNRSAMIRVPLGWTETHNLADRVNPSQMTADLNSENRQTVELRSPDGSALIHLLLAGVTLAAEWGFSNPESSALADRLYVTGNIFEDQNLMAKLPVLPASCEDSARFLIQKRILYEGERIFPPGIINYVAGLLEAEKDRMLNQSLAGMAGPDRHLHLRQIMHQDLHRH